MVRVPGESAVEGIFEPVQISLTRRCAFYGNHIETAGGVVQAVCRQVVLGGERDAALLGDSDAGRGAAETRVTAQADFDENKRRTVAADEVDFAAAAAEIPPHDAQAARFEVLCGALLGPASARARGIVFAHRSWNSPVCHDGRDCCIVCRADPAR